MRGIERHTTELFAAALSVALGIGLVAALASKDQFFFGQFAYVWGPQGAIILLSLLFGPRTASVIGTSIALSLYLVAFVLWERSISNENGLAWLGYFFSFPGAAIGAIIAAIYIERHSTASSVIRLSLIAFAFTCIGLAINQMLVCSTVMYCGR